MKTDDDHRWFVDYIVDGDEVIPTYSYFRGPGTYISAMGYGLCVALGLLFAARLGQAVVRRAGEQKLALASSSQS